MDASGQPTAAWRRRQRRLRSWLRHERQTVAMELAAALPHSWGGGPATHDGPRAQKAASGGGAREDVHGEAPEEAPPPEEPGTQFFTIDDDSVPELGGGRPDPVRDPGPPQEGMGRHTGEAFELVLDPVVPQLGRDLTVLPDVPARRFLERAEEMRSKYGEEVVRGIEAMFSQAETRREMLREPEDSGARSSNKMGKRRKKRKRRKKKLPKGSSSHFFQNSDHNMTVRHSGGMDGIIKLIEEMVIMVDTGEEKMVGMGEFIHKHGQPAKTMYSDRLHLYTQSSGGCWLDWMKERWRYVRRMGCSQRWTGLLLTSSWRACYEERAEQTPPGTLSHKTAKDLIWLLLFVPPDLEFQLGRADAACETHPPNAKAWALSIDDDDEGWVMAQTGNSRRGRQDGGGQIRCMREFTLNLRIFEALSKFYLVQCRRGRNSAGVVTSF